MWVRAKFEHREQEHNNKNIPPNRSESEISSSFSIRGLVAVSDVIVVTVKKGEEDNPISLFMLFFCCGKREFRSIPGAAENA